MKKILMLGVFLSFTLCCDAQVLIILKLIEKVIKAMDLKIQRLQNEALVLQNLQKDAENRLHEMKLGEIKNWTDQQKQLYQKYFAELKTVKTNLSQSDIALVAAAKHLRLLREYQASVNELDLSALVNANEKESYKNKYAGIVQHGMNSYSQIESALSSGVSMTDGERMMLVLNGNRSLDSSLHDLQTRSAEIKSLMEQRSGQQKNIQSSKTIYGLR